MLASHSVRISRIFSRALVRSYASAPAMKPFHYQELLEHEKKVDTPYKKLTGCCLCVYIILVTCHQMYYMYNNVCFLNEFLPLWY